MPGWLVGAVIAFAALLLLVVWVAAVLYLTSELDDHRGGDGE